MFWSSCLKLPSKYFHHINKTEPFSVSLNGTILQFCIKLTHTIEKYGDIGNFSEVTYVMLLFMNRKFVGTWAPTAKIIGDIPDFNVLNVPKTQPQHNPEYPSPISKKLQTILNVRMAWIICIVLFCITSVCAGFYSGNSRNIQYTSLGLVKKIYDTFRCCVILI